MVKTLYSILHRSLDLTTIHKIKVLTTYPEMLVRFSLQTQKETINCIISKKELADELLMLPDGTELAVYGRYNQKRQLVVVKMCVRKIQKTIP
ncbi:hypothetical protein M2921_08625 [Enterococcus faecalis]|nr:hypothetical protein [Enterococcus faecalis]UQF20227.1 hypothetical protein M2921_08625 [Enterococcus faecalis]